MAGVKRRLDTDSDIHALSKELDAVSCPICMDHPHNAVLLLCSSHDKGCRSYICDTSYRHSNCLDRFKKLRENTRNSPTLPSPLPINRYGPSITSDLNIPLRIDSNEANESHNLIESNSVLSVNLPGPPQQHVIQDLNRPFEAQPEGVMEVVDSESFQERAEHDDLDVEISPESQLSLKCPMCRGAILGWEVVEDTRKYLNLKKRSCSRESCSFSGNYQELRRHARRVHPTTRPSDIDPSRERAWRHLEHQREFGDVASAIHSAMPGAVVVGDYVIENGDRLPGGGESGAGEANGPWWTTLFLFQMIGSADRAGEPRARSRAWTRHRRSTGALNERRFLWGENLLGLQDDDDDDDDEDDDDDNMPMINHRDLSPIPRRRRRLTRLSNCRKSQSDETACSKNCIGLLEFRRVLKKIKLIVVGQWRCYFEGDSLMPVFSLPVGGMSLWFTSSSPNPLFRVGRGCQQKLSHNSFTFWPTRAKCYSLLV